MFRSSARPQPAYGLLTPDRSALSFDGAAWEHLQSWTRHVERLPMSLEGLASETGSRLAVLQQWVNPGGNEPTLQAPVMELVHQLIRDIESIETLQALGLSREHDDATGDVRQALRGLGVAAQRIRQRCAPFSASIQDFQDNVVLAGDLVAESHGVEGRRLRSLQEEVGGLRHDIESLERRIDALSVLSRGKKKELEARLKARRAASTQLVRQAETLRAALTQLDPVVEGRVWLSRALGDLLSFVDSLQRLCTDFGSAMTQLAVDATAAQLQDVNWLRDALDVQGETYPWQALAAAARGFVAASSPQASSLGSSNPEVIAS